MPVIRIPDDSGATMKVLDVDGYFVPIFDFIENHEQVVRSVPNWIAREDDILMSAYPKSGTHWIWEVICMLLKHNAERIKIIKETAMLEGITQSIYDNLASPRVFNTHILVPHLPRDFLEKKCKIVYMIRNPKDVAVSFFNHHSKIKEYEFEGKWEDYVKRFVEGQVDYGSWFTYTKHWEKFIKENPEYPIHVLHYEDMKENGLAEIRRLAKFLDVDQDEDLFQSVFDNCQFDKMKKEKNILEDGSEWKDNNPGMYRKGEVGDWKNWFTVGQNEYFDRVYDKEMKDSDVKVRFTLR